MKRKHHYDGPEMRLDQYVVGLYPDISRSYLQQLIGKGLVLVNHKKVKKGSLIRPGDEIEILPFVAPNDRIIEPNPAITYKTVQTYENYVVVEKPPYLPTHPNQFDDRNSFANALVAHHPEVIGIGDDALRPGIVHRLDTNTSGLMLAALTKTGFDELRKLFNERKIHKTYVALVVGSLPKSGTIETDIAHHEKNPRRMVAITSKKVLFRSRRREAKTLYETIESFDGYSLVKMQTLTGRMHQVRVHLSSIGYPLVGDTLYQSPKEKNLDRLGLTRHFLHATDIEFVDPWTQEERHYKSDLSIDLESILQTLRK